MGGRKKNTFVLGRLSGTIEAVQRKDIRFYNLKSKGVTIDQVN
jgi:hypothetical protein